MEEAEFRGTHVDGQEQLAKLTTRGALSLERPHPYQWPGLARQHAGPLRSNSPQLLGKI